LSFGNFSPLFILLLPPVSFFFSTENMISFVENFVQATPAPPHPSASDPPRPSWCQQNHAFFFIFYLFILFLFSFPLLLLFSSSSSFLIHVSSLPPGNPKKKNKSFYFTPKTIPFPKPMIMPKKDINSRRCCGSHRAV